jgi:hypothetical protein
MAQYGRVEYWFVKKLFVVKQNIEIPIGMIGFNEILNLLNGFRGMMH